jgi:hypothetical protein
MKTLIGFDELHPYSVRSFTNPTEHVRAYNVYRAIIYTNGELLNISYTNIYMKNTAKV